MIWIPQETSFLDTPWQWCWLIISYHLRICSIYQVYQMMMGFLGWVSGWWTPVKSLFFFAQGTHGTKTGRSRAPHRSSSQRRDLWWWDRGPTSPQCLFGKVVFRNNGKTMENSIFLLTIFFVDILYVDIWELNITAILYSWYTMFYWPTIKCFN